MSLPLTLAILDGMAVAVGAESYIVPLTNIMESLRPKPENIHPVTGQGDVLAIRGEYVPLVYLHRRFGVPDAVTDPCKGIVVIVESEGANRIGLVVDDLLGQQQVVVKSLEANYGAVDGIGGATVLGDGRVALILDVSRLRESPRPRRPTERRPAAALPRHPPNFTDAPGNDAMNDLTPATTRRMPGHTASRPRITRGSSSPSRSTPRNTASTSCGCGRSRAGPKPPRCLRLHPTCGA